MSKRLLGFYWEIIEVFPCCNNADTYKLLFVRENQEDAMRVYEALQETQLGDTVYKILLEPVYGESVVSDKE